MEKLDLGDPKNLHLFKEILLVVGVNNIKGLTLVAQIDNNGKEEEVTWSLPEGNYVIAQISNQFSEDAGFTVIDA